ncbi:unnamed protein product [Trifolium pratense]|uniref:Uncharacterized protein n=1 Tax=Trifolium pratense TaxID=57577 RepID=A0ACB0JMA9_TRIPR|nr:unnamed protein product [Trifolium pratense]
MIFNNRVIYEEDKIEGSRRHHHHHNPEIRERVEVVEYKRVPEVRYGDQVMYQIEEDVDVETNPYYPRRSSDVISLSCFRVLGGEGLLILVVDECRLGMQKDGLLVLLQKTSN